MDICICMAEFLCCLPETITALLVSYTPIQNKKLKTKTKTPKVCVLQGRVFHDMKKEEIKYVLEMSASQNKSPRFSLLGQISHPPAPIDWTSGHNSLLYEGPVWAGHQWGCS